MNSEIHLVHEACQQVFLLHTLFLIKVAEISLILLWWVLESLDGIAVEVHAEFDTFVEHVLWVIACVDVVYLPRLHEALIVIDHCVDDTVSDSFGDDLLRFLDRIKAQFGLDVLHRDLGIGDVELLKTEFKYGVLQSHDESVVLISNEDFLILNQDLFESVHVSRLYAVDDLEVWGQWLLEERLGEDLSVWNFTHEELNNDLEFLNLNSEGFGTNLWSFSQCLNESGLRFGVLELDGLDSSQVVQISGILVI